MWFYGACAAASLPGRFANGGIVIGLEYALLDNQKLVSGMAGSFARTGLTGMKHYAEAVEWGAMQKGPDKPLDFTKLDWFVREYQGHGFTELTVALKPHSRWGSKNVKPSKATNAAPKPRFRRHYEHWIESVVERYDADGVDDMPGLRWPVRYIEIGTEFSSYEPEPVEEYLDMLSLAYRAAHRAYPKVLVAHAAFLTSPVNMKVDRPGQYDKVWRNTKRHDPFHDLDDIRAVLDRPDLFDVLNLHNLGDPYEIEDQIRWLDYETKRRGYRKPVIISDTIATSYIGWGAATTCTGKRLGLLTRPATEADRCRMAAFLTRLVDKDPATLAWTRGFVAADHVQRAIIAAEQQIKLINLAFVTDINWLTWKMWKAGAGISAWSGAIRVQPRSGKVKEQYPSYHAIKQLTGHLTGYRSIERVPYGDQNIRVYRIAGKSSVFWVAWRNPGAVLLPDSRPNLLEVEIEVAAQRAWVEPVITKMGQTKAARNKVPTQAGKVRMG